MRATVDVEVERRPASEAAADAPAAGEAAESSGASSTRQMAAMDDRLAAILAAQSECVLSCRQRRTPALAQRTVPGCSPGPPCAVTACHAACVGGAARRMAKAMVALSMTGLPGRMPTTVVEASEAEWSEDDHSEWM